MGEFFKAHSYCIGSGGNSEAGAHTKKNSAPVIRVQRRQIDRFVTLFVGVLQMFVASSTREKES
jgi:hypothetical protein